MTGPANVGPKIFQEAGEYPHPATSAASMFTVVIQRSGALWVLQRLHTANAHARQRKLFEPTRLELCTVVSDLGLLVRLPKVTLEDNSRIAIVPKVSYGRELTEEDNG